jgi:hypothetical protein
MNDPLLCTALLVAVVITFLWSHLFPTNEPIGYPLDQALARNPGACHLVVENFTQGRVGDGTPADEARLYRDAMLYRWNRPTVRAIEEVLGL